VCWPSINSTRLSSVVTDEREEDFRRLDQRFEELRAQADVRQAVDQDADDVVGPNWLTAGLQTWILEQGDQAAFFALDPRPGKKPPLHARLRFTLDEKTEAEHRWAFRVINTTHAYSALTKLRSVISVAGFQEGDPTRKLIIVRNNPWSSGPKTQGETEDFAAAGGVITQLTDEDVRALHALQVMLDERDTLLRAWIASRRPASSITLFSQVLADSPLPAVDHPEPKVTEGVPVGTLLDGSGEVSLKLETLRKHIAIFAGSGSGKTVLLRRIIEECALRGVPSIVLDPNYDPARLGDPYPSPPKEWQGKDAARAEEFFDTCEVVVWTPLRTSGRPLTFQPLPDFSGLINDADEFQQAVQMAVDALAGRVRANGATRRADIQKAVLKQSIEFFARSGGGPLQALADLLAELPEQASDLDQAPRIAAEMAQTLRAAMVNDPLFGGVGTPVDPGLLLTPAEGKRARVSVISMIGLEGDEQRQRFISQLQMALFGWFKKHPARDAPLGGLLVMDEAVGEDHRGRSGRSRPTTQGADHRQRRGNGSHPPPRSPADRQPRGDRPRPSTIGDASGRQGGPGTRGGGMAEGNQRRTDAGQEQDATGPVQPRAQRLPALVHPADHADPVVHVGNTGSDDQHLVEVRPSRHRGGGH
jgi:hypothetical protein